MKFSISFKYSNVTFKNKETKETVTYDTKAEGNTFTFDNVDEDVVLGIVKGIKDRKASQVFAYDNLRTNFINVIARNKCKELYDKIEKEGWKAEDIAISSATIKDLEFTKPTMNARENLTVESISRKDYPKGGYPTWIVKECLIDLIEGVPRDNPMWADLLDIFEKYYGSAELEKLMKEKFPKPSKYMDEARKARKASTDDTDEKTKQQLVMLMDMEGWDQDGDTLRFIKPSTDEEREFNDWDELYKFVLHLYGKDESCGGSSMNESKFTDTMRKENQKDLSDLIEVVSSTIHDLDMLYNQFMDSDDPNLKRIAKMRSKLLNAIPSTKTAKEMVRESGDTMDVVFKKDRKDGTVIAFFPETLRDGSCNPGNMMSYEHNGQHGEASLDYYQNCRPCSEEEYADLLTELERIYDDVRLVVKRRARF